MVEKVSKHPRLNEVAYEVVKGKIISGELAPGTRLKEEFLVKMLGISKTPIKLCIAKLEQDGLVRTIPRRGSYVIEMTAENIDEVFSLREVLYGLAIKLAVKNITSQELQYLWGVYTKTIEGIDSLSLDDYIDFDSRFHDSIVEFSRNELLKECLKPISSRIQMIKYRSAISLERRKQACREHLAIIKALENKDVAMAEKAMKAHLLQSMQKVMEQFRG